MLHLEYHDIEIFQLHKKCVHWPYFYVAIHSEKYTGKHRWKQTLPDGTPPLCKIHPFAIHPFTLPQLLNQSCNSTILLDDHLDLMNDQITTVFVLYIY